MRAEYLVKVQLNGVSVRLLLESQRQLDDLVHELFLVRSGERSGATHLELSERVHTAITTIMGTYSGVREMTALAARSAESRGDTTVDLALDLPAEAAEAAETFQASLDAVRQAHLEGGFLLQPPPSDELVEFRRQLTAELVRQLRGDGSSS